MATAAPSATALPEPRTRSASRMVETFPRLTSDALITYLAHTVEDLERLATLPSTPDAAALDHLGTLHAHMATRVTTPDNFPFNSHCLIHAQALAGATLCNTMPPLSRDSNRASAFPSTLTRRYASRAGTFESWPFVNNFVPTRIVMGYGPACTMAARIADGHGVFEAAQRQMGFASATGTACARITNVINCATYAEDKLDPEHFKRMLRGVWEEQRLDGTFPASRYNDSKEQRMLFSKRVTFPGVVDSLELTLRALRTAYVVEALHASMRPEEREALRLAGKAARRARNACGNATHNYKRGDAHARRRKTMWSQHVKKDRARRTKMRRRHAAQKRAVAMPPSPSPSPPPPSLSFGDA